MGIGIDGETARIGKLVDSRITSIIDFLTDGDGLPNAGIDPDVINKLGKGIFVDHAMRGINTKLQAEANWMQDEFIERYSAVFSSKRPPDWCAVDFVSFMRDASKAHEVYGNQLFAPLWKSKLLKLARNEKVSSPDEDTMADVIRAFIDCEALDPRDADADAGSGAGASEDEDAAFEYYKHAKRQEGLQRDGQDPGAFLNGSGNRRLNFDEDDLRAAEHELSATIDGLMDSLQEHLDGAMTQATLKMLKVFGDLRERVMEATDGGDHQHDKEKIKEIIEEALFVGGEITDGIDGVLKYGGAGLIALSAVVGAVNDATWDYAIAAFHYVFMAHLIWKMLKSFLFMSKVTYNSSRSAISYARSRMMRNDSWIFKTMNKLSILVPVVRALSMGMGWGGKRAGVVSLMFSSLSMLLAYGYRQREINDFFIMLTYSWEFLMSGFRVVAYGDDSEGITYGLLRQGTLQNAFGSGLFSGPDALFDPAAIDTIAQNNMVFLKNLAILGTDADMSTGNINDFRAILDIGILASNPWYGAAQLVHSISRQMMAAHHFDQSWLPEFVFTTGQTALASGVMLAMALFVTRFLRYVNVMYLSPSSSEMKTNEVIEQEVLQMTQKVREINSKRGGGRNFNDGQWTSELTGAVTWGLIGKSEHTGTLWDAALAFVCHFIYTEDAGQTRSVVNETLAKLMNFAMVEVYGKVLSNDFASKTREGHYTARVMEEAGSKGIGSGMDFAAKQGIYAAVNVLLGAVDMFLWWEALSGFMGTVELAMMMGREPPNAIGNVKEVEGVLRKHGIPVSAFFSRLGKATLINAARSMEVTKYMLLGPIIRRFYPGLTGINMAIDIVGDAYRAVTFYGEMEYEADQRVASLPSPVAMTTPTPTPSTGTRATTPAITPDEMKMASKLFDYRNKPDAILVLQQSLNIGANFTNDAIAMAKRACEAALKPENTTVASVAATVNTSEARNGMLLKRDGVLNRALPSRGIINLVELHTSISKPNGTNVFLRFPLDVNSGNGVLVIMRTNSPRDIVNHVIPLSPEKIIALIACVHYAMYTHTSILANGAAGPDSVFNNANQFDHMAATAAIIKMLEQPNLMDRPNVKKLWIDRLFTPGNGPNVMKDLKLFDFFSDIDDADKPVISDLNEDMNRLTHGAIVERFMAVCERRMPKFRTIKAGARKLTFMVSIQSMTLKDFFVYDSERGSKLQMLFGLD